MSVDLTGGIDPVSERAMPLADKPDKFRFAENFMVTAYDPASDIGLWIHLGTCPDDFTQWEEQVLVALPGEGGLIWTRAYGRPREEDKPAGPNLKLDPVEPFRTMRVTFDGVGMRSPYAEMLSSRLRDTQQELFAVDITLHAVGPGWDNKKTAESGGEGRGDMADQAWASEHYQQTYRAVGTLRIGGEDVPFDGTGVRDHSRGQRGHKPGFWGGHNLFSAPFPSGKAFGMQRMWDPTGKSTLAVGFVFIDGEFHDCDVVSPPVFLDRVALSGDSGTLVLRSKLGEHVIEGVTKKGLFATLADPWGYHFGVDHHGPRGLYAPAFGEFTWDGEKGYGLFERTGVAGKRYGG
jgi:hypothetical protein